MSFGGRVDRNIFTDIQKRKFHTGAVWRATRFKDFLYKAKAVVGKLDKLDYFNDTDNVCNHEKDFNKYTELRHSLQQIFDIGIVLTEHIKDGHCLTATGKKVNTIHVPISHETRNKLLLHDALGIIEQIVLHVQDCMPENDVIDYDTDDEDLPIEEYIPNSEYMSVIYHNTDDYYNDNIVTRSIYEKTLHSLDGLHEVISNQLNISKRRHINHTEKFTQENLLKLVLSANTIWRYHVCVKVKKDKGCPDGILVIPGIFLKFPYKCNTFELDLDFREMKGRQESRIRNGKLQRLSESMNKDTVLHKWINEVSSAISVLYEEYGIKLDTNKLILMSSSVLKLFRYCEYS